MQARFRLSQPGWWIAAGLAVMVAGAFGPWARVLDAVTINGTDPGKDGWVVLGAAIAAALFLAVYAKFRRRWLLVLPVVAALIGGATAGYDLNDLGRFGSLAEARWGIYLALAGSLAIAATTVWLALGRRRETAAAAAAVV